MCKNIETPNLPYRYVAILDVGHGNSAVLVDTDGVTIIDAGPKSGLLEFLVEQGIKKISTVLISHADEDHLGGLVGLISSGVVTIDCIRLNSDSLKASSVWEDVLSEVEKLISDGVLDFQPSLTPNNTGQFDRGPVHIEVLGPSAYLASKGAGGKDRNNRKIQTNSISSVIKLVQDGKSIVVFPGDLDEIGLDDLIYHGVDATAPILVFPHHGGRIGSSELVEEFVRRLSSLVISKKLPARQLG